MNSTERKALRKALKENEEYLRPLLTAVKNPDKTHIADYLKQEMALPSYEMDPTRRLFEATFRLLKEAGMSAEIAANGSDIVDREFADRIADFWADALISAKAPLQHAAIDTLGDVLRLKSVLRYGSKAATSQ